MGAAWGAFVWLAYGLVEFTLSTGIQLWRNPEMEILGWQWRLIAMLMGAFGLIGLTLGAAGGIAAPGSPRIFASLSLALVFAGNLLLGWSLGRSEYIALAAAIFVSVSLASALVSKKMRARFQFLTSPWTVSLLLLGSPWVSREALDSTASPALKMTLSVLFVLAVAVTAAVFGRFTNRRALAMRAAGLFGVAILTVSVAAAFAGAQDSVAQPAAPVEGRSSPNVLLIVMDTVRADHTSLYGYERDTTPNLRAFADHATFYSRAVAVSDFTLPSHASMFTGVYRDWHGAFRLGGENPQPLNPDRPTLAEVLSSHGYWTASSVANFAYLARWTGLTRGFAVTETGRPVDISRANQAFYLRRVAKRLLRLTADTAALDRETMTAADVERKTRGLLARAKSGRAPFFLFVNYMDAHYPYVPDPPFDLRFPGKGELSPSVDDWRRQATLKEHPLTPAERSNLVSQYDGGITEEDASIGRLLGRLRELGLYDNTLIIITSDHGEAFGEHDLLRHEIGFVYQNLVSIPLIIKYPRQLDPRRSDELVSQVDFMPTILDLAGIPMPAALQGVSLVAAERDRTRVVYASANGLNRVARVNPKFAGTRHAIFAGSLKLISSTSGPTELYDLNADPGEEHNLYSSGDPRAVELSRRLESWVASMPHGKVRTKRLDPATRERLKSLGYVQ
jgi:arylsulfatase A-like enzyme